MRCSVTNLQYRLPKRPSLRHLRQQAKDLLASRRRLGEKPTLQQAQHLLAMSYGFRSWIQATRAIERLTQAAAHVREHLFTTILGPPKSVFSLELVHAALDHPDSEIRIFSLSLLDHRADPSSLSVLQRALKDPVPRVRFHAVHALQCARCKS
jgi:HEAT repeat protein